MSRAVDTTGYVQPRVAEIQKRRAIVGFVQHHNAILPWAVNANGEVRNVIGQAGFSCWQRPSSALARGWTEAGGSSTGPARQRRPLPVQPLPQAALRQADLGGGRRRRGTSTSAPPTATGSTWPRLGGRGKQVYEAKCASCHSGDAKGGPVYGTMVGGIGSFKTNSRGLTPGSMYPYAPILFDYVRRSMPMDRPQTLTNDEVYAVSAYLLNLNGLVPPDAVMDAQCLPKVQMPNRDGFMVDDRPDTQAARCMTNCK